MMRQVGAGGTAESKSGSKAPNVHDGDDHTLPHTPIGNQGAEIKQSQM